MATPATSASISPTKHEDVAWFYEEPFPSVAAIANHVAFSTDHAEVLLTD